MAIVLVKTGWNIAVSLFISNSSSRSNFVVEWDFVGTADKKGIFTLTLTVPINKVIIIEIIYNPEETVYLFDQAKHFFFKYIPTNTYIIRRGKEKSFFYIQKATIIFRIYQSKEKRELDDSIINTSNFLFSTEKIPDF